MHSDRLRGLLAPPRRTGAKDPIRLFGGSLLNLLLADVGYTCSNPLCKSADGVLDAHHIFAHSLGGRTIFQNGLLLCKGCHQLVHRGVVPLSLQMDWKRKIVDPIETFRNADDIIQRIRDVPVRTGQPPNVRLAELNSILLSCHGIEAVTERYEALTQLLLAKSAILNDHYSQVGDDGRTDDRGISSRYRSMSALSTSARYFGVQIDSIPNVVRALHYRSIAYEGMGRLRDCLALLARSSALCATAAPTGNPAQFHPLSTPARLLRMKALVKARLGGSRLRVEREYNQSRTMTELYGSDAEWTDSELRRVQLSLAFGQSKAAKTLLDAIWPSIGKFPPEARSLALRFRIEVAIALGDKEVAEGALHNALTEASTLGLHRQQYHLSRLTPVVGNMD